MSGQLGRGKREREKPRMMFLSSAAEMGTKA